jgi:hypothetical protein
MSSLPEAELSDQSWMSPEVTKKQPLPVAGYSDFNPAPKVRDEVAYAEAMRQARKSYIWIGVGLAMLALSLYMFIS